MNKTLKFFIDTIIIACIPELQKIIDYVVKQNIISCIIAGIIAVVVIIIVEKLCIKVSAIISGVDGTWYEYIISTPERPFSVCRINRNILSGEVEFVGTNYSKELDLKTTVDFSTTHLWFVDKGFIYQSKGDTLNSNREKYGLGKYTFSNDKSNDLIVAKGFFIDTTDKNPKIKDVIMYKSNRTLYEKLGLNYRNRKSITSKEILRRLPKLIECDVENFDINESRR